MSLTSTPSQTVGPYFQLGLEWAYRSDLFEGESQAQPVSVEGQLLDGDGLPIVDAVLELWQADARGKFAGLEDRAAALRGFGRVPTDREGRFRFSTLVPGCVPDAAGTLQAPHISVIVSMRGLLKPVKSRIYFPDRPENVHDPVLGSVPEERRHTLIALASGTRALRWDIHMQGAAETVFFDY